MVDFTQSPPSPAPFGIPEEQVPLEEVPEGEPPLPAGTLRVAVMDYGVKQNILRRLVDVGGIVTVFPADTPAESRSPERSPTASAAAA